MRALARLFFGLAMALILLQVAIGGVVPLWAQQQVFQGQPPESGGMLLDAISPTPSGVGRSLQGVPFQMTPGGDPRLSRPSETPRPVGRQCAATAHWPRPPLAPQPLPGTPPQQVAGVQPSPQLESERSAQQPRPRQARTQGVGSVTVQGLVSATPPQELLTPGIDPPRPAPPRQPQVIVPQLPALGASERQREGVGREPQVQPQGQPGEPSLPLFPEPLSPIELSFGDLRQFGYTVFSLPVSTFAPVDEVPVGPDYVMGPGDDMVINVWGAIDGALVRTVDRNGRIFLPKIGPVRVWGLTFAQADRMIRDELGRYFRGFNTTVTLGRLRTIRVHLVGEVCQPGSYTIGSLSTLTNALSAAGGPTKLGSLRDIRLLRNNQLVGTLDLYDFLLKGSRTRDFRLESGDTIFVPTIGPTVGVEGEVKRPAIYELREPTRVSDFILMAGGVTPRSYLKRVQVIRQQPSAERTAIDIDLTTAFIGGDRANDLELQNGDLVRVFPSDYRVYNVVHFSGAVKYPGDYELKPGTRISQLLTPENLLPEAHLARVEIVRRQPDLATEIVTVDLKRAWSGSEVHDVVLRPLDEVNVRSELRAVGTVTLEGEVKRPGQYSIVRGEKLSSVVRRAGGFTDRAYLRGAVFTRASLKAIEQEQLNTFVKVEEQRLLQTASTPIVGGDLDRGTTESQSQLAIVQARRELLRALASRVAVGRMVVRLDQPEKIENTPEDVVLEDGDTLRVGESPASVLVVGSVRTSTSVQYREGMGVDYYVNRVGGFTKEADTKEVHIVKADGSAASGFTKIRAVEPGDTIIVPPKEEEKVRVLPTVRDIVTIMGQTLISIAALAVLF